MLDFVVDPVRVPDGFGRVSRVLFSTGSRRRLRPNGACHVMNVVPVHFEELLQDVFCFVCRQACQEHPTLCFWAVFDE